MELQKTNGNNFFGSKVDVSSQSIKQQKTQNVHSSKMQQTFSQADARNLSAALGLPADKLSASIISFARFFSLSLNREQLADIRRHAVTPQLKSHNTVNVDNGSKAPVVKTVTEALETPLLKTPTASAAALALAAADSKGAELNNEGLQNYSAAIDPDAHKERQSKDKKRQKREDDQSEQKNKTAPLSAAKVKQTALEFLAARPLLNMLNNLPDANGRRWIVLPFEYDENGKSLTVSLRFFLEQDKKTVKQMVLDIAKNESENRWVFILNVLNKLTLYIEPHLSDRQLQNLETELSRYLNISRESVTVRNRTVDFPCETGDADNLTLSINEAV